jgi:type I restriction enzyme, S subunit
MTWREINLGLAIHIKHGYAFKSAFFTDNGQYIVLTPGNFTEQGGFRIRSGKDRGYAGDIPEGYVLNEGDLIIAMTEQGPGLLGSSALIPQSDRYLHNQRLGLIDQIDTSVLDKRFLFYLFNTRSVRGQISGSASGTKVRHTSPERIYHVRVRVPGVKAQSTIADTLSAYDALIENNNRRIQLFEESARLLYQEWFIRLLFPGYEHTRIVDGIPEGWEKKTLFSVANVNQETLTSSFDGEIEYIDISSVTPGRINDTTYYDFREAPSRARRIVRHGDMIWSCVRPNRRSYAVIWQPPSNLVASTGFAVLTPVAVPTSFLYFATTTDTYVGYLTNHARGAAYPAVVAGDFERAELLIPPKGVLDAFNDFVEPTFSQINNLVIQIHKAKAARDLLLPRLMNGEIAI